MPRKGGQQVRTRRKRIIWILVAGTGVAALALAGCAGGEERAETPAPATQEAEPPAPATAEPPAAASETAQAGVITTVVGTGETGFAGDGGQATSAQLHLSGEFPRPGVAFDTAGNLYFADPWNHRVRRVDPAGVITTVAGTGELGFSGDGGPATEAEVCAPSGLTLDPDGNLYIAERCADRVRKVTLVAK